MTFNLYPSSILLTFTSHFSSVVKEIIIIIIIIIYWTYNHWMFCAMGIAGSAAKLMACAILNDCMICPVRENEAAALSNFS